MPIYEYECTKCGLRFERKQSIHDQPIKVCPQCAGQVRKVLFPVGIVFKGSGFYKTDYASKVTDSDGDKHLSTKPEPTGSAGGAASGSQAKSGTGPDAKSSKSE